MGLVSYLPRSRPIRLGILLVLTVGALHLLDLLPSSSPSFTPASPYPQTPHREEPEDLQQYLGKVLDQARKDSSSDHGNRKKVDRPQTPFHSDAEGGGGTGPVALKGNTLVLATHSSKHLLGLISVKDGLEEHGGLLLPGINSGSVKSWVPKESVDEKDKASHSVEGLITWIEQVKDELETGKQKVEVGTRLGDSKGGVGGVVLGSCELDLPILTPSLLKLHSLLPTTLRFPIVCFLSNPEAFLSSPTTTAASKSDWTSPTILGPWSQLGSITILVAQPPSSLPLLSNHFARLSLAQPSLSFYGYEHIPFTSFVPSLPLPSTFKRAAWRGPKKLGRKQVVKREGEFALMDVGVVDDGSGQGYEALFKRLETELNVSPTTFGYLPSLLADEHHELPPFLADTSSSSKIRKSQFLLHIILPPSSIVPWTAGSSSKLPPRPVVPKRLKEVVDVHWDWEVKDGEGSGVEEQFWKTMDELDILISVGSGGGVGAANTHLPLSLPLSLSLSIPYLTPSTDSSFGYTLSQPHALSSLETIKLLRSGTAEGVEMGTHWNLRREVLEVLKRGWDWHEPGTGTGKAKGQGKVGGWREENWMRFVGGLER